MKKFITAILILCAYSSASPQVGWQQMTDFYNTTLYKIQFLNENTGFSVGNWSYYYLICKTTNGGVNWSSTSSGFSSLDLLSISFLNENTGYAVGGSQFEPLALIMKTTNTGNNWVLQTIGGYESYTLWDVKFANANTGYISGTSGLILKTTNGGVNWIQQFTGISGSIRKLNIASGDPNVVYGVGVSSFVIKTSNGGTNWQIIDFPSEQAIRHVSFLNSNTGYVSGALASYPYTSCLYKTTNQGETWENISSLLPTGTGGSLIMFRTENLGFYVSSKIYKTTNGGQNWRLQESYISNTNYYDINFLNDNYGFITCSWQSIYNGITLKTTNGGDAPPNPPTNLNCSRRNAINKLFWTDNSSIEIGFVIQRKDLYDSIWTTLDSIAANSQTYYDTLEMDSVKYRVCSYNQFGYSAFSNEAIPVIIIVSVSNSEVKNPDEYFLYQNYPNPFNPKTKIAFNIPKNSFVSLSVYDVAGNEVRNIIGSDLVTGQFSVDFDGTDLPSGIYFYRLVAGEYSSSRKMLLVK